MRDRIKKILREENDFDWISRPEKAGDGFIMGMLDQLNKDGASTRALKPLVNILTQIGVTEGQMETLSQVLRQISFQIREDAFDSGSQAGWEEGQSVGYDEGHSYGYDEGYEEGRYETRGELEDEYDRGFQDGEDEGMEMGYEKGYTEGKEEIYYKAFEEGRRYQSGLENEEYERRQDPFTRELDDEY